MLLLFVTIQCISFKKNIKQDNGKNKKASKQQTNKKSNLQ